MSLFTYSCVYGVLIECWPTLLSCMFELAMIHICYVLLVTHISYICFCCLFIKVIYKVHNIVFKTNLTKLPVYIMYLHTVKHAQCIRKTI